MLNSASFPVSASEIPDLPGDEGCQSLSLPEKKPFSATKFCRTRIRHTPGSHEEGPLHYLDVGGKWAVWSIFSHSECSSIAKDPRLSAKRAQQMILPLPFSRQSEFS